MLLVADFESCGIAYLNTLSNGYTLGVAKKSCALGYYSFGHEVSMGNWLTLPYISWDTTLAWLTTLKRPRTPHIHMVMDIS